MKGEDVSTTLLDINRKSDDVKIKRQVIFALLCVREKAPRKGESRERHSGS